MIDTDDGEVDVDIWIVSAQAHTNSNPHALIKHHSRTSPKIFANTDSGSISIHVHPSATEIRSIPKILANTDSGPISMHVHPFDTTDDFAHPVSIGANTDSGNILVTDPTFLGVFQVAAHDSSGTVVQVGTGEEKEVRISRQWRGFVKGTIKNMGGGGRKGLSVVRASTSTGDVRLIL